MNQVIKFPDMRPAKPRVPPASQLPPPSQYRLSSPAIIATETLAKAPPVGRRRLYGWFGVAVALHLLLFLVIWLTPPLRIKWSPSPDAWVPVTSVPVTSVPGPVAPGAVPVAATQQSSAAAQATAPTKPAAAPAEGSKPVAASKGHKERPPGNPSNAR